MEALSEKYMQNCGDIHGTFEHLILRNSDQLHSGRDLKFRMMAKKNVCFL
jgi:hypothetical protein